MEDIILIGYGGHAKSVADTIEQSQQFRIVGYTDSKPSNNTRYNWLGTDKELSEYYKKGIKNAVITIGYMGNNDIRNKIYNYAKSIGYYFPVIIDITAVIAKNVCIEEGTFLGKGVIVNSGSYIGKMCIINSGAIIEHENIIEDYSHISVRATLCGNVHIGKYTFIGAAATLIQNIKIGKECIIGAGSIILKNVKNNETVYGIYNGKN